MALTVGAVYTDLARKDSVKLTYVGPAGPHEVFRYEETYELVQVMRDRVATDIVEWDGDRHRPLEAQQLWERTRHDYAGMVAEILIPPFQWGSDTYVVYGTHYGSGAPGPHIRKEKDFRRIFGRFSGNQK